VSEGDEHLEGNHVKTDAVSVEPEFELLIE
jgi:hypothetical protein